MVKGNMAPTVLTPGDPGRVEVFTSLMDYAKKVAENRDGKLIVVSTSGKEPVFTLSL
jgi:uridine phosphorylase